MPVLNTDFLIIGAGIMGITLALEIKRRFRDCHVTLIEKEPRLGMHASGRNSGVLHAGFYYTKDSLKAKFAREGNRLLTEYCLEKGLPINRCGKLVVARAESELPILKELLYRANNNGVNLELIDANTARNIEPKVKTCQYALWSPTTSSVDPLLILKSLYEDAKHAGISMFLGTAYISMTNGLVLTSSGKIASGYIINTAGLYADRIAHEFGFAYRYTILPFKGLYLHINEPPGTLRTHIYPVPDLNYPFLGVHLTVTVDGHIKIGPTAIPALWREHYSWRENFRINELCNTITTELQLLIKNKFFARLAWREFKKTWRRTLFYEATSLIEGINLDCCYWGIPGIRAQLVDTVDKKLVMDFYFEGDNRSFHLLNAVSPAFTCSLAFSRYLGAQIEHLANNRNYVEE